MCLDCKGPVQTVSNVIECRLAVSSLEECPNCNFSTKHSWSNFPKGCFVKSAVVHFNTHSTGNTHQNAQQLCKSSVHSSCMIGN